MRVVEVNSETIIAAIRELGAASMAVADLLDNPEAPTTKTSEDTKQTVFRWMDSLAAMFEQLGTPKTVLAAVMMPGVARLDSILNGGDEEESIAPDEWK